MQFLQESFQRVAKLRLRWPCHNPAMNVVFLDIDGVLLPFDTEVAPICVFPERHLQALSSILEATDAVLVLSSTWRVAECFRKQIFQAFCHYGEVHGGPLASITVFYDTTDPKYHANRQWEIYRWLQHHQRRSNSKNSKTIQRIRAWVALDDEELLEGEKNQLYRKHFEGHVIKTNPNVGLTMEDAAKAIDLFKQQWHPPRRSSVNHSASCSNIPSEQPKSEAFTANK